MNNNNFWREFENEKVKDIVWKRDYQSSEYGVQAESFFHWGERTDNAIIKLHKENQLLKSRIDELENKLNSLMENNDNEDTYEAFHLKN